MAKTLVIDDDESFVALCREGLSGVPGGEQHSFVFAASDDEALRLMAEEPGLDLAAVSLDSRRISGMAVFKKLTGARLRVPRIAITDHPAMETVRAAIRDGAADFLIKPVSPADLVATLDRVFADCEARRRAWRTEAQLSAIRREIDIAGDLQKRIIPVEFPPHAGLDLAARITPAKDMSGDFYDVFEVAPQRLAIVVADVAGKGIPAAFYMAVARTLIRATAQSGGEPAVVLDRTNRLLCGHDFPGMFVSVFYGVLNTGTWEFTYVNAGHLPPYHIPADGGAVTPLAGGDGVVLGVTEDLPYQQGRLVLGQGDALFFYTDGLTEAFDVDRNQFSDERLIAWLGESRQMPAHALAHDVFASVAAFTKGAEQSDDITSLVIKRG
ncbi:MAG: SpoIIE family protein phosphatase [Magnetospirillum sp.]|nr:SpoIIE family protein phosphatase [Magnetospirillum sp.]